MSVFHFYTEPDILNYQNVDDSFVYVQPDVYIEYDSVNFDITISKFRITNWHTCKSGLNPKAYVVHNGLIVIQYSYDNAGNIDYTKVHAILKPGRIENGKIENQIYQLKYINYKNLLTISLIDDSKKLSSNQNFLK